MSAHCRDETVVVQPSSDTSDTEGAGAAHREDGRLNFIYSFEGERLNFVQSGNFSLKLLHLSDSQSS